MVDGKTYSDLRENCTSQQAKLLDTYYEETNGRIKAYLLENGVLRIEIDSNELARFEKTRSA